MSGVPVVSPFFVRHFPISLQSITSLLISGSIFLSTLKWYGVLLYSILFLSTSLHSTPGTQHKDHPPSTSLNRRPCFGRLPLSNPDTRTLTLRLRSYSRGCSIRDPTPYIGRILLEFDTHTIPPWILFGWVVTKNPTDCSKLIKR